MINSISGTTPANQLYSHQAQQVHQQQVKKQAAEPKDTVVLSPKAKGVSADADHDGH